jgi:membrane-associated protein
MHSAAGAVLAANPIDPSHLLSNFGLIGLSLIIFAECGVLLGFFLPGDTLLFSAGLLIATGTISTPLWAFLACAPIAAVAGNLVGYWVGRTAGPKVFDRPRSRLFRPEYVIRSAAFFDRYGSWTILFARFVPIVRTVATVMAGVARMRFSLYALYSVIGGVLWTVGLILGGYWLGHIDFVRKTVEPLIDPILIGIVVLSLLPVTIHFLRARRADRRAASQPTTESAHRGG